MRLLKITVVLMILTLLFACATSISPNYTTIDKSTSYQIQVESLQIMIGTALLDQAFPVGNFDSRTGRRDPMLPVLDQALKASIKQKFNEANVSATVGEISNLQKLPLPNSPVLLVGAQSFKSDPGLSTASGAIVAPSKWTGEVTWYLLLYKNSDKNSRAVWHATANTVEITSTACAKDLYKTCTDRFADSIVNQMRAEKLIK